MPINITDISTFTDPITAPAGADPANASSVVEPVQKLSNRTRFLRDYCTDVGVQLPTGVQTTRRLSVAAIVWNGSDWTRDLQKAESQVNLAEGYADLTGLLPRNASIVAVRVLVTPDVVRATLTDRMRFVLVRHNFGISYLAPSTAFTLVADERDDGNAALQWVELDLSSSPVPVSDGATWALWIVAGADSGTNKDRVWAVEVDLSCTTIRND